MDNDGTNKRKTLNGTWYLADKFTTLYDETSVRVGTTVFRSNIIYGD